MEAWFGVVWVAAFGLWAIARRMRRIIDARRSGYLALFDRTLQAETNCLSCLSERMWMGYVPEAIAFLREDLSRKIHAEIRAIAAHALDGRTKEIPVGIRALFLETQKLEEAVRRFDAIRHSLGDRFGTLLNDGIFSWARTQEQVVSAEIQIAIECTERAIHPEIGQVNRLSITLWQTKFDLAFRHLCLDQRPIDRPRDVRTFELTLELTLNALTFVKDIDVYADGGPERRSWLN